MLTPKQIKFANLYIDLGNGTEAYRQAYNCGNMKEATIGKNSQILLKHEGVHTLITTLKDKLAKKSMVTKEDLIKKLLLIANDYEDNKEFTNSSGNEDMRKAEVLSSLANSTSSIAALKQISKMLGFDAAEKHEITVKSEQPLFKPLD